MKKDSRIWVGLDVHKDTIAICSLRDDSAVEETREIPNEPPAIRKVFRRFAGEGDLRVCYEAGPCGYAVRRQLEAMGIACDVIAPALIPRRPGERVKTDRRDARKLARLYRAGELTAIHIPTAAEEAVRDLLRCREDLGEDVTRQRHRLGKFLLRQGRVWRDGRAWTQRHWAWLRTQRFADPATQRTFDEYLAQLDCGPDPERPRLGQPRAARADHQDRQCPCPPHPHRSGLALSPSPATRRPRPRLHSTATRRDRGRGPQGPTPAPSTVLAPGPARQAAAGGGGRRGPGALRLRLGPARQTPRRSCRMRAHAHMVNLSPADVSRGRQPCAAAQRPSRIGLGPDAGSPGPRDDDTGANP
jgi:hypothetical protein